MPELLQFVIAGWMTFQGILSVAAAAVALAEFPVLFEFLAYVLRDAKETSLANQFNAEPVVFEDFLGAPPALQASMNSSLNSLVREKRVAVTL